VLPGLRIRLFAEKAKYWYSESWEGDVILLPLFPSYTYSGVPSSTSWHEMDSSIISVYSYDRCVLIRFFLQLRILISSLFGVKIMGEIAQIEEQERRLMARTMLRLVSESERQYANHILCFEMLMSPQILRASIFRFYQRRR